VTLSALPLPQPARLSRKCRCFPERLFLAEVKGSSFRVLGSAAGFMTLSAMLFTTAGAAVPQVQMFRAEYEAHPIWPCKGLGVFV
jgi:hypothetical protein